MPRTQWVLNWPGQVTIAGCQTYWTMEVAEALEAGNLSNKLFPRLAQQVGDHYLLPPPPRAPLTLGEPSPSRTFSYIDPVKGLEWDLKSNRPDTSRDECLRTSHWWERLEV